MSSSVPTMFLAQATARGEGVAFRFKRDGEWKTTSWSEYAAVVRQIASALASLGISTEDKVAILSANRQEWHEADVAILSLGAVTVPIYGTNSPPQVAYIVSHSESKIIFCENEDQVRKVLDKRSMLTNLQKIVVFDPTGVALNDFVMTWDALRESGSGATEEEYERVIQQIAPDQLATLVYTSGTTGPPKGAMLTHHNITWTCEHLNNALASGPQDRKLSYLPLSHIAERITSHFMQIYQGHETWFAQSIETLREDLQACRPTVFFGVPRVWEKFYAGIRALIDSLPLEQKEKAEQAINLGLKRVEATQAGTSLPPDLEELYQQADSGLFALARTALGLNEHRALISGAAPINPEVLRFFHAIGLPVGEVYGQTEDCGPTSINRVEKIKIGTVGPAIDGVTLKIAEDGEVLVKGGNVGLGYFKDPIATEQLIDAQGFMHSGDIGVLDEDGYLRITDRKKDLIITAAGKNIAPQVLENMLKYSPWISQAVVIGEARPYLTAIITLDEEKVQQFADQKSIAHSSFADLTRHPDIAQLVEGAVSDVNAQLARVEQIKKWTVLERDFLQDADEVTPTMKVRRRAINEKYSELIQSMYA